MGSGGVERRGLTPFAILAFFAVIKFLELVELGMTCSTAYEAYRCT